ncbi:hypothetical protein SMSP2_01805 [Limihaloglobus sulfuriphilus]|uniref:Uncharacterized protein n=1 Tax=Limihaloglobus sulfuriphilus TaxID=1851148 RepID=A0A1Q2MFF7_9BACT|nr:hypothetical protein SMSP2_01805 [Limihaloglobus sulfuriphilus]
MDVIKIKDNNSVTGCGIYIEQISCDEILFLEDLVQKLGFCRDLRYEQRSLKLASGLNSKDVKTRTYSMDSSHFSYIFLTTNRCVSICWSCANLSGYDLISMYFSELDMN